MNNKNHTLSKMFALFGIWCITTLSTKDEHFLVKASQANRAEIKLGQLAFKRANSDSVKQMASAMIKDHQLAESELQLICKQFNVTVPDDMDSDQVTQFQAIKKLSGKPFDAFYLNTENVNHLLSATLFQIEIQEGSDSLVKAYATKYLPTWEIHSKMFHNATTGLMLTSDSLAGH